MTHVEKSVIRWANSLPWVKGMGITVYHCNGGLGTKANDQVNGAKYDERQYDALFDMVRGAISYTAWRKK